MRETNVGFSNDIGPPPGLNKSISFPFASFAGMTNHPSSRIGDLTVIKAKGKQSDGRREERREGRGEGGRQAGRGIRKVSGQGMSGVECERIRCEHGPPLIDAQR